MRTRFSQGETVLSNNESGKTNRTAVSHYMTAPVHTLAIEDGAGDGDGGDLQEADRRMRTYGISSLAVTDRQGRLVGVISRTDLLSAGRRHAEEVGGHALLKFGHNSVRSLLGHDVIHVSPKDSVQHAARLLCEHGIHRVYVTEEMSVVGVLSTKDLLRAVRDTRKAVPISTFMSAPVLSVQTDDPVHKATDLLQSEKIHGLVVLEGEWPVGLFTQVEALEARELGKNIPVEEVMTYAMLCLPVDTPAFRAAAQMAETRARRVIAVEGRHVRGILTGLDMARALL